MKKNMLVDLSNVVWVTRHGNLGKNPEEYAAELIFHRSLEKIITCAKKFKADGILIACDGSDGSWRKKIYPEYKANRDKERDIFFDEVKETMDRLYTFFNEATNIPAIKVDGAEADDIIAVASRLTPHDSVIISTDKDFVQLIDHKTSLYSFSQDIMRTTEDPDYELFLKCIRGDRGDNITSAYPRVRETKLKEAWENPLEMANLLETVRKEDGLKVADVYNRNRVLIDLNNIPDEIIEEIGSAIIEAASKPNKYNYVETVRYLAEMELKTLAADVNSYSSILKQRFLL